MTYIESILYYLTWPLLIAISWYAVRWALGKFEKNRLQEKEEEAGS